MKTLLSYSIIIPVFNSSESLEKLYIRIERVFNNIKESFEVIFIDDNSSDKNTWSALESLSEKYPEVKIIQLTKNFGQYAATLCGIENSSGEYIITMDDDLEHLPEEIPHLINNKKHDVVIGVFNNRTHSKGRKSFSYIKDLSERWILKKPAHIKMGSFRLMKKEIAENLLRFRISSPYFPALLLDITHDIVNVEINHGERISGKSNYSLFKLLKLFSHLLFHHSSGFLKFIGFTGIFVAMISFLIMLYFIYKKIFLNIPVPGYTSIITSIFAIGGLLLFSVGVLGEYLARAINSIEQKPIYIIRRKK